MKVCSLAASRNKTSHRPRETSRARYFADPTSQSDRPVGLIASVLFSVHGGHISQYRFTSTMSVTVSRD